MMPEEKQSLLTLFDHEGRWCQNTEAQDEQGNSVTYDDASAVAWDLTGGMCLLFGWRRACVLFRQLDRHISGQKRNLWSIRDPEIDSMAALQDYNDQRETTFETIMTQLRAMPVWREQASRVDDPQPDTPLETPTGD